MAVYIALDALVIIITLFDVSLNLRNPSYKPIQIFNVFVFLVLFFVAAFRGDFAYDYVGYEMIYAQTSNKTLWEILSNWSNNYPETGFLVFLFFTKTIFNNKLFVFILSSALIVFAYLKEIKEHFPKHIIPLLLFVEMGTYYTSFNVVRQIMAAAIIVLGLKHLYNKSFFKYLIAALLASTIHESALIMIPMYFVLRAKWGKKVIWLSGAAVIILIFLLPTIMGWVTQYMWQWYDVSNLLGTGFSVKNIVAPLFISAFPIINGLIKKDTNDIKENIWLNGTYVFLAFSVLGMQVGLLERFASFFAIFAILSFAQNLYQLKSSRGKNVVLFLVPLIVILYGLVVRSGSGYDPYYFIWQR